MSDFFISLTVGLVAAAVIMASQSLMQQGVPIWFGALCHVGAGLLIGRRILQIFGVGGTRLKKTRTDGG